MKTNKIKTVIIGLSALFISTVVMAQKPAYLGSRGTNGIPDLTDEQNELIDNLRTDHLKNSMKYHAEIDKLEAELKVLEIADNADLNKINAKIDEIADVKAKLAKERSKHRQDIRKILTEEQKVYFDRHSMRGRHNGHGNYQGIHKGNGYGQDQGRGQARGPGKEYGQGQCWRN
ncbi:MAG: Spy/CpxP family protein refolding chaperone [Bacteroidales bacterium]|nr:Spy/CpxP family protein refolding chaperone [Bacteroidales bacterium]MBN2819192.1 Spy/CpxP family protein refolding chaperone [Bacteroidales bacterium]